MPRAVPWRPRPCTHHRPPAGRLRLAPSGCQAIDSAHACRRLARLRDPARDPRGDAAAGSGAATGPCRRGDPARSAHAALHAAAVPARRAVRPAAVRRMCEHMFDAANGARTALTRRRRPLGRDAHGAAGAAAAGRRSSVPVRPPPGAVALTSWEELTSLTDLALEDAPFVVFDLETTGTRPGSSRIVEIGAVRMLGFEPVASFERMVNPGFPVPETITRITGIQTRDVRRAARIERVLPEFIRFAEGAVLVAHNARFDVGFVDA